MFYNYNYLSQKSDNLSRLALFGSVAKVVHKSRAGQENFQCKYDILLYISFRMLFI